MLASKLWEDGKKRLLEYKHFLIATLRSHGCIWRYMRTLNSKFVWIQLRLSRCSSTWMLIHILLILSVRHLVRLVSLFRCIVLSSLVHYWSRRSWKVFSSWVGWLPSSILLNQRILLFNVFICVHFIFKTLFLISIWYLNPPIILNY